MATTSGRSFMGYWPEAAMRHDVSAAAQPNQLPIMGHTSVHVMKRPVAGGPTHSI